jgi:hypothetical protein
MLDQDGQAYDPFSFGTGVSGPNQAQGTASNQAAQSAAVEQRAEQPSASKKFMQAHADVKEVPQMSGLIGGYGTAMRQGAQAAMGDPNVNPITGQSWFQNGNFQYAQNPFVTSDEREKKAMEAFDETPGYSYNYKDPDAMGSAHGRQYGIMAQDLEKTPAGRSVVKTAPSGTKMVDTSRLALVEGAALNGALKRIAELEKRLGKKAA